MWSGVIFGKYCSFSEKNLVNEVG